MELSAIITANCFAASPFACSVHAAAAVAVRQKWQDKANELGYLGLIHRLQCLLVRVVCAIHFGNTEDNERWCFREHPPPFSLVFCSLALGVVCGYPRVSAVGLVRQGGGDRMGGISDVKRRLS